jgi:RNA polymerase sigma factor (TIGR02999 family)
MGYAARAMRCLVIDYARRSRAAKRGGGVFEITLTGNVAPAGGGRADGSVELERLSEALDELAALEPGLAQLVDLHFFCGYRFEEIAKMRGVSDRTVQRDWRKARLLLQHTLGDEEEPPPRD